MILEFVLWLSVVISITTSIMRAANIGYQKESYFFSVLASIPMVYDAIYSGSRQSQVLNIFYMIISVFGMIRWMKEGDKKK